jgi:hypothetical protein
MPDGWPLCAALPLYRDACEVSRSGRLTGVIWQSLAHTLQQGPQQQEASKYHSGRDADVTGRGEERSQLCHVLTFQLSLPVCQKPAKPGEEI